jgi:aldehyde:ferredoxin oxidoreductase
MNFPAISGYHGRILEIDLSRSNVALKPLDKDIVEKYLGGRGLATKIFSDRIDPTCDPLSKENVLVLATSPLLGTAAPTACQLRRNLGLCLQNDGVRCCRP